MIKTKKQMFIVISVFALVLFLGGITYAWFTYRGETGDQELIAGDIYLTLNEGNGEITLTNVFPETKEEARARESGNFMTFSINGLNTSDKTIYYEFILNHGTDKESPKTRYNDSDLRFDLVEIDASGNEVSYLLDAVSYSELINKRIWVDTVAANTSSEIVKRYKLRMWLDENVIISDTESNATYNTTEYKNKYATIKLIVNGDFQEKSFGYQKVLKSIEAKKTAETNSCNPTWKDSSDGIIYFSGTNDCVDMNYVWYSGKLWRITAIYPDGAMKLITQNNITSLAFNESGGVNFYTDENNKSYMYQWLNEDFYDTLYNASEFIDTTKEWNATKPANETISTKPAKTNMVTAKVGLLNNYEYYNSYRNTSNYNGYLNIKYYWWLLNQYNEWGVWHVHDFITGAAYFQPSHVYGVRPSIVIKFGLELIGEGTSASPYRIVGDKDIGGANELINTRLSGEYVKLKSGNNEQVFRIIGVEDNKTKIIAMDYADNRTTHKFATSRGSANTLWGNGTTTGEDTWYTYLNVETTGYFDTLKNTYGELFDSGTYYLGTSGLNYKLSVCANITSGSTKECDKTSNKGTFNVGLPRYGEMFAAQQAGGNSNSITMWLMNRYDTSDVWYVNNNGDGGNYYILANAYGGRPTVHLKSSVKILSGTGTESDPYLVGL